MSLILGLVVVQFLILVEGEVEIWKVFGDESIPIPIPTYQELITRNTSIKKIKK